MVLDAELVAVDRGGVDGSVRLRAFQELSTRARGDITSDQVQHICCSSSVATLPREQRQPCRANVDNSVRRCCLGPCDRDPGNAVHSMLKRDENGGITSSAWLHKVQPLAPRAYGDTTLNGVSLEF